jgi:alpha-1,3-rhamnosyltransferase
MVEQKEIKQCEGGFEPLVSIIVITYNSSKHVLETLESTKAQTYKNIELIISDDYSTDDTIIVCETWIKENKDRFVRTKLITVEKNTGIPANCNRGIKEVNGEWFKLIAGDDILLPNCLTANVQHIQKSNNKFVFSLVHTIDEKSKTYNPEIFGYNLINLYFFNLTSYCQYKKLIKGDVFIPAATSFINKKAIVSLGGFDEEITLCEDYPMWLKATKNEFKLDFFNEPTVNYRIHSKSIMNSLNYNYEKSMKRVFFKYRFNYLIKNNFFKALELLVWNLFRTKKYIRPIIIYLLPSTYLNILKIKLNK